MNIEAEALILFKDYSHLELKNFKIQGMSNNSEEEIKILNQAIKYHSIYTKAKIDQSK